MKTLNIIITILLTVVAILLGSCTAEHLHSGTNPTETSEVVLKIGTRATGTNIDPEETIQTLRIYAFRKGSLEAYHYLDLTQPPTQGGTTPSPTNTANIVMTVPSDIIDFYIIANENAAKGLQISNNGTAFTLPGTKANTNITSNDKSQLATINITEEQLKNLTFNQLPESKYISEGNQQNNDETGKIYQNAILPMTGIYTGKFSGNATINIELVRSVAKLKLQFSKTGSGELYMGRGIYLYNEPAYGYLFTRQATELANVAIDRVEADATQKPADWLSNPFYNDSHLNQLNGRIMLKCGWPEEPENSTVHEAKLEINAVTSSTSDPTKPQYQTVPDKSFYLFANPNVIQQTASVTKAKPNGTGYYLKIMAHEHVNQLQQDGSFITKYRSEIFYLPLPQVEANDFVTVKAQYTLEGQLGANASWMVEEWKVGGGDITFN